MEGVAFAMADGYDALRAAGTTLDAVSFIGGGSKSAFWARLCANATGLRDATPRGRRGRCGTRRGAACTPAATDDTLAEVCVAPPVTETVAPDAAMVDLLAVRLAQYRRLYHAARRIRGGRLTDAARPASSSIHVNTRTRLTRPWDRLYAGRNESTTRR